MRQNFIMKLVLALFIVASISSPVLAARKVLNVPMYKQEKSTWCWAADDKMIIQYLKGSSPSQSTLVAKYGSSNGGAPIEQVRAALTGYKVTSSLKYSSLTYSGCQSQINNNRPIFCRLTEAEGLVYNHGVVMRGYDTSTSYVLYIDPADQQGHGITYSNFLDGWKYDGQHSSWDNTILDCR